MADSALIKKLGIKAGQRMLLMNAPAGYRARLEPLPDGVTLAETPDGIFDFVQLFAVNTAAVDHHAPTAVAALKPGGILWIAYPKQTGAIKTDISRDRGWDAMNAAGYRPVTQVAIDETWSGLRFRPADQVAARRRPNALA